MAIRRSQKHVAALKKTRRYRDQVQKTSRKMQLERLEERRVMATTGPALVNVLTNYGPLAANQTLNVAPREITLRFAEGQRIDPATIQSGIVVTRSGLDNVLGDSNDVTIAPGAILMADTPREVIIRFAENLPDDLYRITLVGTGLTPLTDVFGQAVNGGADQSYDFNLDLGAQIVAIVPQPITRDGNGQLVQSLNTIEVYFNPDEMNPASVQNPAFYKLIDTTNGDVLLPTGVVYEAGANKATLTFAADIPAGTFKLKAGVSDEANGTLTSAIHVGGPASLSSLFIGDDPALSGVAATSDVDLYRIEVRENTSFNVSVAGSATLDAAVRLFDSTGAPIGGVFDAEAAGGLPETIITNLTPGTYYIGVSSSGNVTYNPVTGAGAVNGNSTGTYSLSIVFNNTAPVEIPGTTNDSSFATAGDLGVIGLGGQKINATIDPMAYTLIFPGWGDDPGHRQLPPDPSQPYHLHAGPDGTQGIEVRYYNFRDVYGRDPQGNILHNAITENQKQRAREIFEIYGRYFGVKFIESDNLGYVIATGDPRAVEPTIPTGAGGVAGIAGGGVAVMDHAETWGNSEYGGGWFTTAMHEIGHLLGLGHSYDLPPLTIQGSAETPIQDTAAPGEPVFPGDHDILHGQTLYRPEARDLDLYKFTLTESGRFTAETIAERLSDDGATDSSLLNTVVTLWREKNTNGVITREIIARNDDYFSSDSFIDINLEAGTYFIGVTAQGMTGINPNVSDSGFGGLSDGDYRLEMNFTPAVGTSMVDATGTKFDGDLDGQAGGAYEFFFNSGSTIVVDKATTVVGGNGTLASPYSNIEVALANATPGTIVRIVGNDSNLPYLIGYDNIGNPLADGNSLVVPQYVTLMIDAGAIIKLQKANIDVGSSSELIDRSRAALQVLGTPDRPVELTSYHNDEIGGDSDGPAVGARPSDWGGVVFRHDSDREDENIFLNYVNHANITYGGGKLFVDSIEEVFTSIHVETARPTLTFNTIKFSADAAISADPNSFDDRLAAPSNFADVKSRIGPEIYGNTITNNTVNGLFIRIKTDDGAPVDVLTEFARFDDTDIVHVITENLHLDGTPGGPKLENGILTARTDARLHIDPGVIVKLEGARIEARIGSQLIAEGTDELPIIFTSRRDDRFGVGGTFDTTNDGATAAAPGQWAGLVFNTNSIGSIDRAKIYYGGGVSPIEGDFASFSPIEVHQADVRVTKSLLQSNAAGDQRILDRNGRGSNAPATIFVRGSQPIIVDNIIRDNDGNVISINANAMISTALSDYGRSTASGLRLGQNAYDARGASTGNFGPLVRGNRLVGNETNGMEVRGAVLTTETVWDDTDIAHILRSEITVLNQHVYGGIRLQSSASESLVVKLDGNTAGFVANGQPMDIDDRIGGTIHIIGQPGRPVVLTSLADDTVPAGLQPITDLPLFDTNGDGPSVGTPGDWNSIRLDRYSNDRNAAIVIETEPALIGTVNDAATGRPIGDQNRNPQTNAQFLGTLAPNEKSGDENRRLGFDVQGFIALDNSRDVDVYSFKADGGTEVWIDIDRSSYGLNAMLELVNANGDVLARSLNDTSLSGLAQHYQKDTYLGRDFYTTNPNDPIMRVTLPGSLKGQTFFIRVRSEPDTALINNINAGQTRGDYRLQVRLRQVDNKPGSTIRYADIRYATNGIEVIGLPHTSPLAGDSAEAPSNANGSFGGAQHLGNLLTSDRGTITVGGTLDQLNGGDVDFYSFNLDYDFMQVIGGYSDAYKTAALIFDLDYADGLSRPDTTISVFDQDGRLIYIGRDSDISDDQPGVGQGIDSDDLSRGTFGKFDPYIGPAQMPAGSAGAGLTRTYYVAISSKGRLPTALNATFQANPSTPLIRLEPINSVRRIVEDHVGFQNGSALADDADGSLFDVGFVPTVQELGGYVTPFQFSDVNLFGQASNGQLMQVDPFDGVIEVSNYGSAHGSFTTADISMRSDGRLYGYQIANAANTAGRLIEFDPGAGTWTVIGNDSIPDNVLNTNTVQALVWGGNTTNGINSYTLYYSVAGSGTTPSTLFRANPANGSAAVVTGQPWGSQGAIGGGATLVQSATTGLAFLNGAMYGVSSDGQFYRIDGPNAVNNVSDVVQIPGVQSFNGLALGPQNVDGGAYSEIFFATGTRPNPNNPNNPIPILTAFDVDGNPQVIFDSDGDGVVDASMMDMVNGAPTSLAFSPLDFNLWHMTRFRESEAGHTINQTPDNSRGTLLPPNASFYFGLETWTSSGSEANSYFKNGQDDDTNAQYGIRESGFHRDLTATTNNIQNNYDLPGGAYGSLTTNPFSLAGYKSTDKPTFYFDYFLETQGASSINNGNMRDSARVYISTDGGTTWELIASNNSQLDNPQTISMDGELPTFLSQSMTEMPNNTSRQQVQELFDNTGDWRQARVDLSRYAGQSNLSFRFDFATSGESREAGEDPNSTPYFLEDVFGNFNHNTRGTNNDHGGWALDNFIVGFAERGEMVTNADAGLATFFAPPTPVAPSGLPTPTEVLSGSYQLEIRRAPAYGANLELAEPDIGLFETIDTNIRYTRDEPLAPIPLQDFEDFDVIAQYQWTTLGHSGWGPSFDSLDGFFSLQPGDIANDQFASVNLQVTTGEGLMSFDWRVSSEAGIPDVKEGDRLQFYVDGELMATISGEVTELAREFYISAGAHVLTWTYVKDGTVAAGQDTAWLDNVSLPGLGFRYGGSGDDNQFREQGQILIEQNMITDSAQIGILVDAAVRTDTHLPSPGAIRNLTVANVERLVPGVVLMNNVVGNFGTAGIRFSGDPNPSTQGPGAVPYGRIVNNTIYGGATPRGTGIHVTENAGPTILNNIISNSNLGISVDGSSAATTVVGANLYAGNTTNANGNFLGTDAILLQTGEPLFVNPANRNFYLMSGSKAIDSSLNTLADRPSITSVKSPLAISESPIFAPEFDMFGQKRLDEPTQDPPQGLGTNIFKDRGGVERADFTGPSVRLIDPLDNDTNGRDRDPNLNSVIITNEDVPRFILKLLDVGIGIDDIATISSQFSITQDGVLLTDGVDYTFIYNPNTDEVTFLPNAGIWASEHTYVITIDNTLATGVKDVAGNALQPNRLDGGTRFEIFIGTLVDYGDAPAPYPTLLEDDGARHTIVDGFHLGPAAAIPSPDTNGQPSDNADADDAEDGLTSWQFEAGLASTMTVESTAIAKLDVWIDLNQDGDWDDLGEKIVPAGGVPGDSFSLVVGQNVLNFDLPADAARGTTGVRLRMSSAGTALPTGLAADGEVEDYLLDITGPLFQNPSTVPGYGGVDVNGDGFYSAIDALIVINYLNTFPGGALPIPGVLEQPPPYIDVNGDGSLSSIDAVIVINYLNANPVGGSEGEGEGEGSSLVASTTSTSEEAPLDGLNVAIPGTLYASSSVVMEERETEADPAEIADQLFANDAIFASESVSASYDAPAELTGYTPESQSSSWDDLVAALALEDDEEDSIFG